LPDAGAAGERPSPTKAPHTFAAANLPVPGQRGLAIACAVAVVNSAIMLSQVLVAYSASARSPRSAVEPGTLTFFAAVGLIASLFVLVGVWRRHPLAQRSGTVLVPCGAGILLLFAFQSRRWINDLEWIPTGLVVASGLFTPFLWTRPDVKRFFGLVCPGCGSVEVRPESTAYRVCSCAHCSLVYYRATGKAVPSRQPLPLASRGIPPSTPPPMVRGAELPHQPQASATSAVPDVELTTARTSTPVEVIPGRPGKARDLTWLLLLQAIAVLLFALAMLASTRTRTQTWYYAIEDSPSAVETGLGTAVGLIWVVGLIYWFLWIYRSHREYQDYTGHRHPISPVLALALCFVPIFNLFWVCYMPYKLAQGIRADLRIFGKSFNVSTVVTVQIIGAVLALCVWALPLTLIAYTFTMGHIQRGLNTLWAEVEEARPNDFPQ
jgi:hypothetical protein